MGDEMTGFNRAILALWGFSAAFLATGPVAAVDRTVATAGSSVRVETFAAGLVHPWGLAILPDGRFLVTERPGRLRLVASDGKLSSPLVGVPQVDARGQGGLLDVVPHPNFASNNMVYLTFSEAGQGGNGTAIARGRLETGDTPRLANVEVIFRQLPKVASTGHFGSRLAFDPQGYLWATLGERQTNEFRKLAQDLGTHMGKVIRLHDDGRVPPDNPFVGNSSARPEIWSYGHRNPQGMAVHPQTGIVWTHEHGPRGGDAVNTPRRGGNHGWPIATYGREYWGGTIFSGDKYPQQFVEPLHHWTPSIAPSGMAFYASDAIAGWRGSLLIGGLSGQRLVRLEMDGDKVVREEHLLREFDLRIRDVRVAGDGAVYLLTDEEKGEILRLTPAAKK